MKKPLPMQRPAMPNTEKWRKAVDAVRQMPQPSVPHDTELKGPVSISFDRTAKQKHGRAPSFGRSPSVFASFPPGRQRLAQSPWLPAFWALPRGRKKQTPDSIGPAAGPPGRINRRTRETNHLPVHFGHTVRSNETGRGKRIRFPLPVCLPGSGVCSAAAVSRVAEHTAGHDPLLPNGPLLTQAVESILDPGFIHIGSEHQAAKAKGTGFIKYLLHHSNNLLVLWERAGSRLMAVRTSLVFSRDWHQYTGLSAVWQESNWAKFPKQRL